MAFQNQMKAKMAAGVASSSPPASPKQAAVSTPRSTSMIPPSPLPNVSATPANSPATEYTLSPLPTPELTSANQRAAMTKTTEAPSITRAVSQGKPKAKPERKLLLRFDFNTEDPDMFPRFRKLEKAIHAEVPRVQFSTDFAPKGEFELYLNGELWFSKKTKKDFPDEKGLIKSLKTYEETGEKVEVPTAAGEGCIIS